MLRVVKGHKYELLNWNCHMAQENTRRALGLRVDNPYNDGDYDHAIAKDRQAKLATTEAMMRVGFQHAEWSRVRLARAPWYGPWSPCTAAIHQPAWAHAPVNQCTMWHIVCATQHLSLILLGYVARDNVRGDMTPHRLKFWVPITEIP